MPSKTKLVFDYDKDWGLIHIKIITQMPKRAVGLKHMDIDETLKQVLYENSEQYFRAQLALNFDFKQVLDSNKSFIELLF